MTTEPASVLLLGDHAGHMAVKAEVLRHFWGVRTVLAGQDALAELVVEVVVVCSTLPPAERQDWVDRIRLAAPGMVIVKMNGYDAGPHANADATVDESHGPGALVSTIYGLLTERGLPSRPWAESPGTAWVQ